MRKWLKLCLVLGLCLAFVLPAGAETAFTMAGFDPESAGHDWPENYFFRRMEERTGVHFTFRQVKEAAEWAQYKAGLSASGELPDVLFKAELSLEEIERLYREGVIIDLRPYLAEHMPNLNALLSAHPEWEAAITLPDGAIAALPQFNTLQNNNAMWINARWLRALHLEAPTTAEELTAVLRAFKADDPNRNGKADEVPFEYTGFWDLRWLGHAFGLVSDDYSLYAADGKVSSTLTDPRNYDFLAWLHTLWEERLIDRTGLNTADALRQVTDSNATITFDIVMGPSASNMIATAASEDFELLMPMQYEGQQRYRSLLGAVSAGTCAITRACGDPARVLEWLDFLYTEEGCFLAYTGLEGTDWERSSDGNWNWLYDMETVSNSVLPDSTIGEGASIPGYVPVSYQLTFDNEQVHKNVVGLDALSAVSEKPMPDLLLTEEERRELDALWQELGPWAETRMTWFVTGDMPLDEASWNAFCEEAEAKGLSRQLQGALDRTGVKE